MLNNNDEVTPIKFFLSQNYPNPFKEKTTIKYCVAYKTRVQLTVYNTEGEEIEKLVDEEKQPGTYEVEFSACHSRESGTLDQGYYFYRMIAGDFTSEKKWLCINKLSGRLNMKNLIQTLFFFLLTTQICFGQWFHQNSGTNYTLSGSYFSNNDVGWIVGESGTILRTTNGGIDWTTQSSGTTAYLSKVHFVNETTGWICGSPGTILKTTNGGQNWFSQNSGTSLYLCDIYFSDLNTGWVVGGDWVSNITLILNTTDGGINWIPQINHSGSLLYDLFFIDSITGWAVGDYSIILKTTNGGSNWIEQHQNPSVDGGLSVFFTDYENGWVVGWNGIIMQTSDGGTNWSIYSSNLYGETFDDVFFVDSNNGWIAGGGFYKILKTTDGGENWYLVNLPVSSGLASIFFTDENTGWATGANGTILHTINGSVPVELISFAATTNGNEVILNWSTATELNNQGFEIQRSIEGVEFFTVGFVNGYGTTSEKHNYTYADKNLVNGEYYYRLKQVDYNGSYEYSDVVEVEWRAFNSYLLEQNYPNPFNPTTTIGFGVENTSNVKIEIINSVGEEVAVLLNEEIEVGYHKVEFNASALSSGVYFYQLRAGHFIETKKMLLLK
jgi:photosystem II stability/assembly factor-like uncharacterized protein